MDLGGRSFGHCAAYCEGFGFGSDEQKPWSRCPEATMVHDGKMWSAQYEETAYLSPADITGYGRLCNGKVIIIW